MFFEDTKTMKIGIELIDCVDHVCHQLGIPACMNIINNGLKKQNLPANKLINLSYFANNNSKYLLSKHHYDDIEKCLYYYNT